MITKYLMYRFGWETVWMVGVCPQEAGLDAPKRRFEFFHCECLVGTWTGPDADLLCVRPCDTSAEAEKWLSPPGRTILHAALRSFWLRLRGPRKLRGGNPSRGSRSLKPYLCRQKQLSSYDLPPNIQGTSSGCD